MITTKDGFLPYGRQSVDEDDIAAVTAVLRSDWLTTGPVVEAFETAFAERTGADWAVSCSSGTAALHLAALALALGPTDTVIVPAMTFLASVNAFRITGAGIVFADVDPDSGLMTTDSLARALGRPEAENARAAVVVHMAGQCPDMAAIARVASARGVALIEDACHALGSRYGPGGEEAEEVPIGACTHAAMAAFSLHPVKTATMGEGGVLTTNQEALAERARRLRNHGMESTPRHFRNTEMAFDRNGAPNPWYYEMSEIGLNYRASDINCALGLSQLAKLDQFVDRRRRLAARYDAKLAPLAPLVRPLSRTQGCNPAWHLYVTLIDFDAIRIERAAVIGKLREKGIGTQVHYIPVHLQPYYR